MLRTSLSERTRSARFAGVALATAFSAAAVVIACSSSSSGGSGNSGGDYCARYSDYVKQCSKNDACSQARLQSCAGLASDLSAAAQNAALACVTAPYDCSNDGGAASQAISTCIDQHLAAATPTAAQAQVKTDFCKQCPDGASMFFPQACTNFFAFSPDGGLSGVGAIVLTASDSIATQIDQQCTGASANTEAGFGDCGFAFLICSDTVISAAEHPPAACGDGGLTGMSARLPLGLMR